MRSALAILLLVCACGDNTTRDSTATITASPRRVLADGRSATTVVVRVRDASGAPMPERAVTFAVSGSGNRFQQLVVTDEHGIAVSEVRSTSAEPKTITASGDAEAATEVEFTPLAPPCATPGFGPEPLNMQARFVGDVNGDGKLDLLGDQLALGRGDATFEPARSFIPGSFSGATDTADFDEDGRLDVVTAQSILFNDGGATFHEAFLSGASFTARAGDFDGDGHRDIAFVRGNAIDFFYGNGDGTFGPGVVTVSLSFNGAIERGNFNADTLTDLVIVVPGSTARVILGRADRAPVATNLGFVDQPNASTTGDINKDGNLDILVVGDGHSSLLLGTGTGTFTLQYLDDGGIRGFLVDLDGDAHDDLVLQEDFSGNLRIYKGGAPLVNPTSLVTRSVPQLLADVDADGRADLIGFDAVYRATAHGQFDFPRSFAPNFSTGLVADDFDDDPAPDLIHVPTDGGLRLLSGRGDGTFAETRRVPASPFPFASGDFDLDGRRDLVAFEAAGVSIALNSSPDWLNLRKVFLAGTIATTVAIGDIDGDLRLDFVATARLRPEIAADSIAIYRGRGDGTFEGPAQFNTRFDFVAVAIADLDRDGRNDIVVAGQDPPINRGIVLFLRGNANGFEAPAQLFVLSPNEQVAWMTTADLDAIPGAEIILASGGGVTLRVLHGDGQVISTSNALNTGARPLVFDVNRDGYLDVITSTGVVLLGDGNAGFSAPRFFVPAGSGGLTAADFTGDGRADLATSSNVILEQTCR